jgi:hypothetical protein
VVTYTVHEPPVPEADRVDRGAELEFVKDGFSWLTAICPPLGLLANGLWLFAIAYLVLATAVAWALTALKVDPNWIGVLFLMANIFLGFELSSLQRWMLDQMGWTTLGVVTGSSIAECERRFFESWLPGQPIIATSGAGDGLGSAAAPRRGSRFWPFASGT